MTLRMIVSRAAAPVLLALVCSGAPAVQAAVVDYVGFAWESGGLEPSLPGDELSIATVVTGIDPLFDVDLNVVEATLFIAGLTSVGDVTNPGSGVTVTDYVGGTLRVYADPLRDHDWGTGPANATVPSTFSNGDLVFAGAFDSFTLIRQASGQGVFEGMLSATGGSALAGPCTGCAYTFAGTFAAPTGAQIPAGYDLQVDGILDVESTVGVESMSWGSIKTLFRAGN
jgi:hypothetical protein